MTSKLRSTLLLLWHYLNQPLFDSEGKTAFKPRRFLYLYRVQMLERCLDKHYEPEHHHFL